MGNLILGLEKMYLIELRIYYDCSPSLIQSFIVTYLMESSWAGQQDQAGGQETAANLIAVSLCLSMIGQDS